MLPSLLVHLRKVGGVNVGGASGLIQHSHYFIDLLDEARRRGIDFASLFGGEKKRS